MGITITATMMCATHTPHTARLAGSSWEVTWLRGRALTRSQAVTAMQIAVTAATRDLTPDTGPIWGHLDGWAAELSISGLDAVSRASESPEDAASRAPAHAELAVTRHAVTRVTTALYDDWAAASEENKPALSLADHRLQQVPCI